MNYRIVLPLLLALLLADTARAQDPERLYRVELLVLSHLDHGREALEVARAGDYSSALDLLAPPPQGSEAGPVIVTTELPAGSAPSPAFDPATESGQEAGAGLDEPAACTGTVAAVTEMGPEMEEAWRRLRLSAPFRPLQYLSWQQPGSAPFPRLRVHDDEVLFTEDPWAELRRADAEAAAATGPDAGPLPSPIDHYRLDGAAQLVRTRFLHLELDLEWREAAWSETVSPGASLEPLTAAALPVPAAFRVHRLQQRRQVRTGRLEYFDTPVLGVLALITDVSHLLTVTEED